MTTNNRRIALAAAVAATVLLPRSSEATISRSVSFDEKVDGAAAVVLAHVVKSEARWDPSKRWILTYTTFKVDRSLKGEPIQNDLTLVTPGGEMDGIRQETIGAPAFEPGEEQVVFVANSKLGPTVAFMEQGAYDVQTDSRGEKMIMPAASDSVVMDQQRGTAAAAETPRSLNQFERAVKQRVQTQRAEMEMIQQRKQASPLVDLLARNKSLVALAVVGALLATWQLLKQR
jgi:hypothetical protein